MMRPFLFHLFIASFPYIMLSACTDSKLLHSYKPLPAEGWERRDTVSFDLPQAEEEINGTLTIGLRTIAHVGMQDVVLAVEQCLENPNSYRQDTVRYPLTNTEGDALVKGVNFRQYEMQQLPIRMEKGQSGSVRIHHLMRREDIFGFTEIGIKIEKRQ